MSNVVFKRIDKNKIVGMTNNLITRVKKLSNDEATKTLSSRDKVSRHISVSDNGIFLFEGPVFNKYYSVIESIKKDADFKDVSYSKIEGEYRKLIINLSERSIVSKDDVICGINSMLNTLRESIEQRTLEDFE